MSSSSTQETRTRSGRLVKRPDRYVPTEKVEDDYATDEHDTDIEDDDSDILSSSSSEDDESDSEGSLVDFIVPDDEEDEE